MKILVVEDDAEAAQAMVRGLTEAGHVVSHAIDGAYGLLEAQKGDWDVYVVDRMMPRLDGIGMVETLRKNGDQTPVLFLSAMGEVEDRITGLKAGGDDYLVKPFAWAEFLARTKSVLRRNGSRVSDTITCGDLTIDVHRGKVRRGDLEIELTTKEFQLLELLLRHHGEILSRTYIAERIWDMNFENDSNVIDVNIRRLRAKMDDPFDRKIIHTVRGRGYVAR